MKAEDVPQDDSHIFKGYGTKVIYAVGKNGKYTTVKSSGWKIEELVLLDVVDEFRRKAEQAKDHVLKNTVSPIEYFMYKNLMDLPALATGAGFPERTVRRHLNPEVFDRLDDKTLQKYADFFNIDIWTLKNFKESIH
jgi:hypothetical protein